MIWKLAWLERFRAETLWCHVFSSLLTEEINKEEQGWVSRVQFCRRYAGGLPSCLGRLVQGQWLGLWQGLRLRPTRTDRKNWVNWLWKACRLHIFEGRSREVRVDLFCSAPGQWVEDLKWQSSAQYEEEFFNSHRHPKVGGFNSGGGELTVLGGIAHLGEAEGSRGDMVLAEAGVTKVGDGLWGAFHPWDSVTLPGALFLVGDSKSQGSILTSFLVTHPEALKGIIHSHLVSILPWPK